jgi:3-mercaptopyruvate sulfurtransferase SseA
MSASGIPPATPSKRYGDNNWFAAYAFWLFRHGHKDVLLRWRTQQMARQATSLTVELTRHADPLRREGT